MVSEQQTEQSFLLSRLSSIDLYDTTFLTLNLERASKSALPAVQYSNPLRPAVVRHAHWEVSDNITAKDSAQVKQKTMDQVNNIMQKNSLSQTKVCVFLLLLFIIGCLVFLTLIVKV